jgi:hypothetical protein
MSCAYHGYVRRHLYTDVDTFDDICTPHTKALPLGLWLCRRYAFSVGIDTSIWIPIAFGAATGAVLGLHEERLEAERHPSQAVAMPQQVQHEHARPPIFVQVQPTVVQSTRAPHEPGPSLATRETLIVATAPVSTAASLSTPKKRARPARTVSREMFASDHGGVLQEEELTSTDAVFRAETACARQDPEECLRAARAFRLGIAVAPNPKSASIYWHSALRIYEDGCQRRDPVSCVGQAAIYEQGKGEQPTRAPDLLERARGLCSDRYQSGCDELDHEAEKLRAIVEPPEGAEPIVQ